MWFFVIALALLAGGLFAYVYLPYRRQIRAAYRRLDNMPRQTLATACGPIEVAVRGEGPPLLSIHGSAGGFDQALDLAEKQVGTGFKVIAPSRFGYLGTSLLADATPASQAEAFVCLLDALGVAQTAVITSSAGGPSAIQLALRYPDRVAALVMVSTAVADKPVALPPRSVMAALARSDFLFWLLAHPLRPLAQRMFIPADYEMAPQDVAAVADLLEKLLPIRPRAAGLLFDLYVTNADPHANRDAYNLEALRVPTLVINAKDDPMANYADARAMSARIPQTRLISIPSGGHVLAGSGEWVSEEIGRFLRAHTLAFNP